MIVWVASYPRSGNTFARVVLTHLYGVPTRDVYQHEDQGSAQYDALGMGNLVGHAGLDSLTAADRAVPSFVKTHELPSDRKPAIYIVRDGRDAITSYAHFALNFEDYVSADVYPFAFHETVRNLIISKDCFGGWSKHVKKWTRRWAPTAVIRYEDLVVDPIETIRGAMAKLQLRLPELPDVKIPPFEELNKTSPTFFRRGKIGSYLDEMTPAERDIFWKQHGKVMTSLGYKMKPEKPSVKLFSATEDRKAA